MAALAHVSEPILQSLRTRALRATPAQIEGPFYPVEKPAHAGADLYHPPGQAHPADGTPLYLSGRVTDIRGAPLRGTLVEIWQADRWGLYRHPDCMLNHEHDPNFPGYGATHTEKNASYAFRALTPTVYPGRAPHIHMKVFAPGFKPLTTQIYQAGVEWNAKDAFLNRIPDAEGRRLLQPAFTPATGQEPGAMQARFDVVLEREGA